MAPMKEAYLTHRLLASRYGFIPQSIALMPASTACRHWSVPATSPSRACSVPGSTPSVAQWPISFARVKRGRVHSRAVRRRVRLRRNPACRSGIVLSMAPPSGVHAAAAQARLAPSSPKIFPLVISRDKGGGRHPRTVFSAAVWNAAVPQS